ncbi:maestro heat-like repeat-containing protein family member 1 isoform X2 [Nematostella vectensis]|uniref:maestro heat-like repeat-containing protein family member 1 isoform X2 n=1 Tax=Nematostella vectensis TaxID=45351 RepID=UPI0020770D54|nr:maestro heat-like repeat-containing protein family member 1 isoform X2 [Nematostella vectensis]
MASEEVRKTGGQIDELCVALVDAANDKQDGVREVIIMALHDIGKKQPEMVLTTIKAFLIKHQKLSLGHRVVLLRAASAIIKDVLPDLDLEVSKQLIKLASDELTKSKEIEPEWQTAASEVLVALGKRFDHEVMAELLDKLAPGTLPHYFIVQTLASFASANAFGVVPFLKDILGRMLPMMGMAKQDNMKWVFANCLGRFSESIIEYVANAENAPYPDISLDRFHGEIDSAYDILFNIWLKSNEAKIRLAVVDAVGHMTHILSQDKLEEQLPKLLPGITNLYKKHTDHYLITQGLCSVLDAACCNGGALLSPHLDPLLGGLHNMACVQPDFINPSSVKNHNELLRCFSVLARVFSDRVVAFLLAKLEPNTERTRIGSLAILKHLVNSSGSFLENKEELIVAGVQILLNESNLKVRRAFAQAITAMAHHRYLELEGGHKLVEFIVKQCALQDDEKQRRPTDIDSVSPLALRAMCENILQLLTTTVPVMEPVLWPYLLECVVPEPFTHAMTAVCKSLSHLAAKRKEEEDGGLAINFETQTNIPKPEAIISRLIVMSGHPLEGIGRGSHVLKLLQILSPILNPSLVEIWDSVIPKLLQYLEEHSEDPEKWNQKAWEDLVLKLLSKSLDEADSEDWVCALGKELSHQLPLYAELPNDKNFLFKCIGIVLRKVTQKDFLQIQLNEMFNSVKHSCQIEREGCAIGLGFCAGTNLDIALIKLEQITKTDMVKKSSGILGFMKDKTDVSTERVKSTVMLCYGYAVLYGPPSLITSRLEASVFRIISKHFSNVKDVNVKQNIIRMTELIAKALEPSRLQQPDFVLTKRSELINHMLAYIRAEPSTSITTETRALALDACASLVKLNPRLTDAEVFDVVKTSFDSVFAVQLNQPTSPGKGHEASPEMEPSELLRLALESVDKLLKELVLRDPVLPTLQNIFKHIENPWLISILDPERDRAMDCALTLLNEFKDNMLVSADGKEANFTAIGPILARIVPRCTDPLITVRQNAIDSIQTLLRMSARYQGYSPDSRDDLIDALATLQQRAQEEDATIMFSVASDLSKVIAKKIPCHLLPGFIFTLMEGLTDSHSYSSSGACVVFNSVIKIRGQEMRKEVHEIIKGLHEKLCLINHQQTRTGTLRIARTIASHHLVPLLTALLEFPLPYDQHIMDIWKTLAGDPSLALSIYDYLLDLLVRSLPYNEKPNPKKKKEIVRIATLQPCAITCGLTEMFRAEDATDVILENVPRLFSAVLSRLGTCVGLLPPEPPKDAKKGSGPHIDPLSCALDCIMSLLDRCQYTKLSDFIAKEDLWKHFRKEETFPEGITLLARGLCLAAPQHVAKVVNCFQALLCSVYDSQRIVVSAFFSELIDQQCSQDLVEVLMNSLMGRLVDSSRVVRKYCIRGLGNISSASDAQIEKYSTTILSAMMAGMDDKDDPEDEITLEAMSGLSRILARLDENNVRQILINICLRVRPCFEKEKDSVRAAAFTLFGALSRFGDGPSRAPYMEQVHTNLMSVLLHMNEEPDVAKACKGCLRAVGPLMGSDAINAMFQKHLLEEGHLHYGEFMNDLSRLIIADFPEKISFYSMGCVSFFKSSRDDIKANAALFLGFVLGNLPVANRDDISKDHICSEKRQFKICYKST